MSAPLVPSPLDYVGLRRFAFYPNIMNADPNEWVLGTRSWSEVQVVNARTGREIWIPRQYIGAVSDGSGSLLIVGLRKELEFRAGSLEPCVKRVIEIPHAPADDTRFAFRTLPGRVSGRAPVVGIRLEDPKKSRMREATVSLAIGILLAVLVAALIGTGVRF
jgi:hypothetical protein